MEVPAREPFVRTIRLVTGDAAARAGFTIDQIEDVRLVVTELCFAILVPRATVLGLHVRIRPARISVTGTVDAPHQRAPDLDAVANFVIDSICDRCTITAGEKSMSFAFETHARSFETHAGP